MADKTVIITGGNSGLGYECAKAITAARDGWQVVIAGRNEQKLADAAKQLRADIPNSQVEPLTLDLASLKSVRNFDQEFSKKDFPPLRALVCNAGIQVVSGLTFTEDGFETTFGVNHLGHFLLVNLLLKRMIAPARIVVVSSDTHDPAQKTGMPEPFYENAASLAKPEGADDPSVGRRRYTTSKLCNIFFTYKLSRRFETQGLAMTANAFNPGLMPGTGLARDYSPFQRFVWNHILPVVRPLTNRFVPMNSASESGKALARLVLDPTLEKTSGKYFSGLQEIPSSKESYDLGKAFELWETSSRLVGLLPEKTL